MRSLPYTRFLQLAQLLVERKEEETREKYILQAFNAWLMGAGQKKSFGQFLKHLRLDSKPKGTQPSQQENTKETAQRHLDNARRIMELDRQLQAQAEGQVR